MASKLERLRAHLKNVREKTERIGKNVLHAGETLVVGGAAAYAEGRMSDDTGEWGFKGVPYAYAGGAVLYLTGLFAGEYGEDLFAAGTGLVGSHLFRSLYESGVTAKQNKTSGHAMGGRSVPMGLGARMQGVNTPPAQRQATGTVFDGMR